ncbi:MAG: LemA family protein [Prevotellaceae bacterium]|nr:LemA family protein [Candidatus Minthosoma caballi]
MSIGLIITLVVAVLIAFWAIGSYNSLVQLRNNRENAFSNIDVQLTQRADLIPQLVATVKGYANHEKETFQQVTAARSAAVNASTIEEKIKADQMLSSALAGLRVTVEAYPELKADKNFLQLQGEISDIENKLAAVRRFFNSATREFNNAVETFPGVLIAKIFGFHREPMYEVSEADRATITKAPEIKF